MNIYTYVASIQSSRALMVSLKNNGAIDPVILVKDIYSGGVKTNAKDVIITTVSTESVCDSSINDCLAGELIADKELMISKIESTSVDLVKKGLEHTSSQGTGVYPLDNVKGEFGFNESLVSAASRNPSEMPQIIPTEEGAIPFVSLSEIESLADDVRHRYEYIYTNPLLNADSSKSELLLKQEIGAAATKEQLDAVVDSRL